MRVEDESTAVAVAAPMTKGRVLRLAVPMMGENLLQTLVVAVDTLMVARLGKAQIAGVGASAEFVWFIISILIALDIGATVLVSQAIGAGDREGANRVARQAIVWGGIASIPIAIAGFFMARPLFSLFGVEPDVARHATTYLRITVATGATLVLTFVCGAVLRGAGDSRTPLYASVAANVVNLVAAYGLIFGHFGLPELGVAGSAWGGTIARATSATILITLLVRGNRVISIRGRSGWRPHLPTGRALARLGVPATLEEISLSAGFMVLLRAVATLGTAALAAQQIAFTALSLAFMPGFAFGTAATALIGQSVGARKPDDARSAFRIALLWSVVWMGIGGLLYFVAAGHVMALFTDDPEVARAGRNGLRALSLSLPFWAMWAVGGGALRGVGDTRTPVVTSAITVWGVVGLAFLVVNRFDGGLGAVWLTFLITSPISGFGNWWMFRRRIRHGLPEAQTVALAG